MFPLPIVETAAVQDPLCLCTIIKIVHLDFSATVYTSALVLEPFSSQVPVEMLE